MSFILCPQFLYVFDLLCFVLLLYILALSTLDLNQDPLKLYRIPEMYSIAFVQYNLLR